MPEDRPDLRILGSPARDPDQGAPPEPPRGRLGRIVATLLCLLVLAGIGYAIWFWPASQTETRNRQNRPEALPVVIATAAQGDVPVWLDALGTVQAFSTVTVKPMVDGQLVEVRFQEGQDVKTGDVLARIDPRAYQAALDQATAKKAQDEALLANARLDFARYTRLVQNNYASGQQADTARAQVAQLEAQVAQDQAQIDTARTNLSYTTITAPIDGRAGIRLLDQGNIAHASDTTGLVVLATLQPISVMFTLPQQALRSVTTAMRAGEPEVVALNQATRASGAPTGAPAEELDHGRLTVLDNQVDPATGTIKLKATFPNPNRLLWPGGFVGVRLRVDTIGGATTVPPAAVQRGPRGSFVYVLREDGTVARRTVTVGYEDQGISVITDGVRPGDRVVTDGTARLSDGARATVVEPAPAGAAPSGPPQAAPPGARRRGSTGGALQDSAPQNNTPGGPQPAGNTPGPANAGGAASGTR